ncbi:DUF2460 domain-containing protein [Anaeromyxobacter sp. PSR-1]|uniref:DUF2460 domain-containing protein n=1 Tax=Anaeromyxobacter sp. PSR-1 TaxID=1300915 RepID=UPI0005E950E0|nr:DUF2460 domain-containing protein [Anaeromyxobacter sp. PSR-1]GAO01965.1 hypothetical protein PSR1_00830 [Anaeromyxobacter sp. PSR-1]
MSNDVFPDLPGLDVEVDRTTLYRTSIYETAGGKEQRAAWWSSPRYRYRLRWNVLRADVAAAAPWAAYSEAAAVQRFFDVHLGAWDSFLMVDPYSGAQVRVRFVEDSLRFAREVPGVWAAEAEVISVK